MQRRTRAVLVLGGVLGTVVLSFLAAACGNLTGLLDELETAGGDDDAAIRDDAEPGDEAGSDARAPTDATTTDARAPTDASHPADSTVPKDATPPFDAAPPRDALPPIDAMPPPIVVTSDCPDADATLVYVVTEEKEMLAFNPADGSFRLLGLLACPTPDDLFQPFSMAVDRAGRAYVLYNGVGPGGDEVGDLYQVSLATLECTATRYRSGSTPGFTTFGMGFATNLGGPTEQLYVADEQDPPLLGVIDTTTFVLSRIAELDPQAQSAELTGTGDGRLFGFFQPGAEAAVGQIDKTSGKLTGVDFLPGVDQGEAWAFGFWGGNFYLFTSPLGDGSDVTRFDPADQSVTVLGHYPGIIVGAGVSTCAPEQ